MNRTIIIVACWFSLLFTRNADAADSPEIHVPDPSISVFAQPVERAITIEDKAKAMREFFTQSPWHRTGVTLDEVRSPATASWFTTTSLHDGTGYTLLPFAVQPDQTVVLFKPAWAEQSNFGVYILLDRRVSIGDLAEFLGSDAGGPLGRIAIKDVKIIMPGD